MEDMEYSLAHYYIKSSHNTYLTGHQITGVHFYFFSTKITFQQLQLYFLSEEWGTFLDGGFYYLDFFCVGGRGGIFFEARFSVVYMDIFLYL